MSAEPADRPRPLAAIVRDLVEAVSGLGERVQRMEGAMGLGPAPEGLVEEDPLVAAHQRFREAARAEVRRQRERRG